MRNKIIVFMFFLQPSVFAVGGNDDAPIFVGISEEAQMALDIEVLIVNLMARPHLKELAEGLTLQQRLERVDVFIDAFQIVLDLSKKGANLLILEWIIAERLHLKKYLVYVKERIENVEKQEKAQKEIKEKLVVYKKNEVKEPTELRLIEKKIYDLNKELHVLLDNKQKLNRQVSLTTDLKLEHIELELAVLAKQWIDQMKTLKLEKNRFFDDMTEMQKVNRLTASLQVLQRLLALDCKKKMEPIQEGIKRFLEDLISIAQLRAAFRTSIQESLELKANLCFKSALSRALAQQKIIEEQEKTSFPEKNLIRAAVQKNIKESLELKLDACFKSSLCCALAQ